AAGRRSTRPCTGRSPRRSNGSRSSCASARTCRRRSCRDDRNHRMKEAVSDVVVGEDGPIEGVLSHRDLFFGPLAWSIGQGRAAYEKLLSSLRVKDVMHRDVVAIDPTTSLREAAGLLRERKIGCLPVVEADRLVGLLTEGDFVALAADASSS